MHFLSQDCEIGGSSLCHKNFEASDPLLYAQITVSQPFIQLTVNNCLQGRSMITLIVS